MTQNSNWYLEEGGKRKDALQETMRSKEEPSPLPVVQNVGEKTAFI